jgi:hypothetical protein
MRPASRQAGLDSATAAEDGLEHVRALLGLADPTDPAQARAIGDIIENAARARQPLPTVKEVRARLRTRTPTDEPPTMAEYLPAWLDGRLRLSTGTRRSYDGHIKHWLVPQLGPIRIDRLTRAHLKGLLAAIEERNELVRHARASGNKELLAAVKGHKTVGPATVERIRATLRKALNDAIRDDLLTANPATHPELPDVDRPKPILWTPTRVAHWKATGQIPGPVMVWTPPLIGQFSTPPPMTASTPCSTSTSYAASAAAKGSGCTGPKPTSTPTSQPSPCCGRSSNTAGRPRSPGPRRRTPSAPSH